MVTGRGEAGGRREGVQDWDWWVSLVRWRGNECKEAETAKMGCGCDGVLSSSESIS
jgi:hypothetical protein